MIGFIDSEDDAYSIEQEEVDEDEVSFMIATSADCIRDNCSQIWSSFHWISFGRCVLSIQYWNQCATEEIKYLNNCTCIIASSTPESDLLMYNKN